MSREPQLRLLTFPVPAPFLALVAIILTSLVVGSGLAMLGTKLHGLGWPAALTGLSTAVILVWGPGLSPRRIARSDWFFPLTFPMAYILAALMGPLLFLTLLNQPIGTFQPERATREVVLIMALGSVGSLVGARVGLLVFRAKTHKHVQWNYGRVLWWGRMLLATAVPARIYLLVERFGEVYGTDSVNFGPLMTLDNVTTAVFFAGVVLTVLANAAIKNRLLGPPEVLSLLVYSVSALLVGNRSDLIAPAIFLLWGQHSLVKKMRVSSLILAITSLLVLFQGVLGARSGQGFITDPASGLERVLRDYVSPVYIAAELSVRVPQSEPYFRGSTYLASLKRQIPSPLANRLFGEPTDTATFLFREMIGFRSTSSGYGFSLPAEGYLNFGLTGSLATGILLGLFLSFAYSRSHVPIGRSLHLLYPVFIAALPLALRADSLAQLKSTLYPMIIVSGILYLSRNPKRM